MPETKIIPLTAAELDVLGNAEYYIIKQSVTKKVQQQFHVLKSHLEKEIEGCKDTIPDEADCTTGRIFRGENYKGFPYIVLDYPRLFNKNDVYAFRTMCWFGHHFSHTIHLSGKPLESRREAIQQKIHLLQGKGFYYCVHTSPWEYYYDADNYRSLDDLLNEDPAALRKDILEKDFIKLSRRLEIKDWESTTPYGVETFRLCMELIT